MTVRRGSQRHWRTCVVLGTACYAFGLLRALCFITPGTEERFALIKFKEKVFLIRKAVAQTVQVKWGPTGSIQKGESELTVPDSVTHIGNSAFSGFSSLKNLTIPNSVTHIGDYAFEDCISLETLTIPNSVTFIGDYAFSACRSLKSLRIPPSVTHIGNSAFHSCSSLKSLAIPNSVTHLGIAAFYGCSSLETLTMPEPESDPAR